MGNFRHLLFALLFVFSSGALAQRAVIGFWKNAGTNGNCPSSPPVVTELGENSGSTSPLTITLTQAVPVGSFLIAQVAYRSINDRNVSDSKGNTWTLALKKTSSTQAAAVYYTKTTVALAAGDQVILSHAMTNAGLGMAVLMATNVSTLDLVNSSVSSTTPGVTTAGNVQCPNELLIGVASFGLDTATFTPTGGYTLNYGWQGGGSGGTSGGFSYLSGSGLTGTQSYAPTVTSSGSDNFITVIATFY